MRHLLLVGGDDDAHAQTEEEAGIHFLSRTGEVEEGQDVDDEGDDDEDQVRHQQQLKRRRQQQQAIAVNLSS